MMRNWNRREFTRNAAMLALFSPFIRLVAPEVAQAQQVATGPAKYLLIITSNGTAPDIWTPSGGAGSLTLPTCLNTLEPVKNDVILLNEFDSKGTAGGHGAAGAITGTEYEQTSSLDFFVADDLRSRGVLTQVPSVHLGGVSGQTGVSFRNNALQQPTFDPALAFRSIFDGTAAPPPPPPTTGGGGGGETPAPTGPSEATMRLLRRRSVLDVVTGDIGQLERAFNGIEREKLQIHIQSLRDLESRIAQNIQIQTGQVATPVPGNGGGTTAPTPTFVTPVSCQQPAVQGGLQPIENSALHLEIATAAFACDITRVAHVEFGHHQSCPVNIPGASGDWHNEFMHANSDRTELTATEQFVAARVADTINRLKATQAPDGNGSLYSQTFILWAREMGDAVNHRGDNMPYMISGGAGGYLRGGNSYIRGGGTMHLSLLMAAAEAMGARDTSNFGGKIGGRVGGINANDRLPFAGIKA